MRLKISSDDGKRFTVTNADTGEALEGVHKVSWNSDWVGRPKVEMWLTDAAIDVSIDASRVEAVTSEDGKYARTKLLDVARLQWRRRSPS